MVELPLLGDLPLNITWALDPRVKLTLGLLPYWPTFGANPSQIVAWSQGPSSQANVGILAPNFLVLRASVAPLGRHIALLAGPNFSGTLTPAWVGRPSHIFSANMPPP